MPDIKLTRTDGIFKLGITKQNIRVKELHIVGYKLINDVFTTSKKHRVKECSS